MLLMLMAGHNNELIGKLLCILGSTDDQLLHSDFYDKRQLIAVYFHWIILVVDLFLVLAFWVFFTAFLLETSICTVHFMFMQINKLSMILKTRAKRGILHLVLSAKAEFGTNHGIQ